MYEIAYQTILLFLDNSRRFDEGYKIINKFLHVYILVIHYIAIKLNGVLKDMGYSQFLIFFIDRQYVLYGDEITHGSCNRNNYSMDQRDHFIIIVTNVHNSLCKGLKSLKVCCVNS